MPERYEISLHKAVRNMGVVFASGWWLFLTYMMFISRKDGLASYIAAYGFYIFASCFAAYVVCELVRSKLVVTGRSITQYFPFAPPKTYCVNEITRVVIHSVRRGGTTYCIYIGKKKVFELHNLMENCNLLLETLQENKVPFKNSVF